MGDEFNACLERKPDYANKKAEPCSASVDPEGPDSYRENPRLNKHLIVFVLFLETVLDFECICCFSYS